jgi:hypothetical protein
MKTSKATFEKATFEKSCAKSRQTTFGKSCAKSRQAIFILYYQYENHEGFDREGWKVEAVAGIKIYK